MQHPFHLTLIDFINYHKFENVSTNKDKKRKGIKLIKKRNCLNIQYSRKRTWISSSFSFFWNFQYISRESYKIRLKFFLFFSFLMKRNKIMMQWIFSRIVNGIEDVTRNVEKSGKLEGYLNEFNFVLPKDIRQNFHHFRFMLSVCLSFNNWRVFMIYNASTGHNIT